MHVKTIENYLDIDFFKQILDLQNYSQFIVIVKLKY